MILFIFACALGTVLVGLWLILGRDVLRASYVDVGVRPGDDEEQQSLSLIARRHEGMLQLAMIDHVDPTLVLIVLRLDSGGQLISTIRVDQFGSGISRLDDWRLASRRVLVVEKPRTREVIVRPLSAWQSTLAIRQFENGATTQRWRLILAAGLAAMSLLSSMILMCADGFGGSVSWTHHAGLSAAPLLLVAVALLASTIGIPIRSTTLALRLVTIAAFVAWGVSQLLPSTGLGTLLDDIAILLFVIDAGIFVASDSLRLLRSQTSDRTEIEERSLDRIEPPGTGRAA
jgi:hypothetical protein